MSFFRPRIPAPSDFPNQNNRVNKHPIFLYFLLDRFIMDIYTHLKYTFSFYRTL